MPPLPYIGQAPDSDASVVNKAFVDQRFTETAVDQSYVDSTISTKMQGMATKTYVDQQDSPKAPVSYVDQQDLLYIPKARVGATTGVAPLGADGKIPTANLYTLPQRSVVHQNYTQTVAGNLTINSSTHVVARLVYSDPGWPYRILPFTSLDCRTDGSLILECYVRRTSDNLMVGYGSGSTDTNWHRVRCVPSSFAGANGAQAGLTGGGTLELTIKKQSGTNNGYSTMYQFQFYALIIPVGS